jgi:puromycin-sensitive aminopeptidase
MLEQFIGEETFRDAIRLYLQKHSYANTETSDLWNALETVSKQPIGKIMDGWVFGSGYPLVSISPGKTDNSISVSVKDFKYLANGKSGSSKIIVPLFLKAKTADGKTIEKKVLVEGGNTEIDLGTKYNWVVANAGGHGFYRVAYNPELLTKLSNDIDSLLVIERFNLVSDTWAAVLAGQASTEDFLNLVCLLKNEEDPNVWSQAIGGLNAFYRILPQANRPSFETMVQETLMPIHKKLGWTSSSAESSQTKQLRGMVIATLGKAGNHKETQEKAKALVQNYFKDKSSVDPDVVPAVVSIYAYTGADAEYNEFNEYRKQTTISPQEETRFLFALAEFKHKHLVDKTLGACLDKTDIRTQNAPFLIANVMHNETAADRAWSFVKDNFEKL